MALNLYDGHLLYSLPAESLDSLIESIDKALSGVNMYHSIQGTKCRQHKQKNLRSAGLSLTGLRRISSKKTLQALRNACVRAKTEEVDWGFKIISATATSVRTFNPMTGQWTE